MSRPSVDAHRLATLAVALLVLVVSALVSRDLGLTTDEPRYIDNCQRIHAWFEDLVSESPAVVFAQDRLEEGWYYARPESKNLPLVSLVGSLGHFTLGLFDGPPHSYRWGNLVVFAITAGVMFSWLREELSAPAAIVGVMAMVGMPRMLSHAALMSIDPLVGSFQVLTCWALWRARDPIETAGLSRAAPSPSRLRKWGWPLLFGLLAGLGAMTKPTFWLLVPAWLGWILWTGPRQHRRAIVALFTVAPLVAIAVMPPWWFRPIDGFLDYIDLLLNDPVGWKIDAYYLGHVFQAELAPGEPPVPVPWHSVPWLSLATTPPWIVVLVLIEVVAWVLLRLAGLLTRRGRNHEETLAIDAPLPDPSLSGLWLLGTLVIPVVVMLPSTPAHDGTRLYRPAFYFAAILAACGFERLRRRWLSTAPPAAAWTTAGVLGAVAAWTSLANHPAGLSYYSLLAGGFREAARPIALGRSLPEPRRPLYEVSYWWELFNEDAIHEMQSHLPRGARLTFFPEHYGRHMLQKWGVLRSDLRLVGTGEADYMVMYARMGRLMDPRVHPSGTRFLHSTPIWEHTIDGVRVAILVRVNMPGTH